MNNLAKVDATAGEYIFRLPPLRSFRLTTSFENKFGVDLCWIYTGASSLKELLSELANCAGTTSFDNKLISLLFFFLLKKNIRAIAQAELQIEGGTWRAF